MTANMQAATATDRIRRYYQTLRIRRLYANLIDVFTAENMIEDARALAELAVSQGIWRDPLQRPFEFYPSAPSQPLYDAGLFWFTSQFEDNYARIREEVDRVSDSKSGAFVPAGDDAVLIGAGEWDQVIFWNSGRPNEQAMAQFPVLGNIIAGIPDVTTFGVGVVTLSWVHPGSHIIPHCGNSNARLRMHFGIKVPEGAVMRVGTEMYTWQEGKCLVFDDSYEHEVWHRGTQPRVVLIVDILNPFLTEDEQARKREKQLSLEEQILSFMNELGVKRVDATDDGVWLQANSKTEAVVRQYMSYSNFARVEVENGVLRSEHAQG